jgi:hypothetical protein
MAGEFGAEFDNARKTTPTIFAFLDSFRRCSFSSFRFSATTLPFLVISLRWSATA